MTDNPSNPGTPEAPVQPPADDHPPKDPKDPTDTTPRGNPPVDEEALAKGKETLDRVKPY